MMEVIRNNRWTVFCAVVVAIVAYFAAREGFREVLLDGQRLTEIGTLLATAIFVALVIERAVEVIVSNRYKSAEDDANAEVKAASAAMQSRRAAVQRAQTLSVATVSAQSELEAAETRLAEAKGGAADALAKVKKAKSLSAALLGIGFGLAAAAVGVRILGPFIYDANGDLIPAFAADEQTTQLALFRFVDIALSAVVLAGGADGIHKIINSMKPPQDGS